jgi:hypothetical protein
MMSYGTHAAANSAALKWARGNPDKQRQNTARWRHSPENAEKMRAQWERAKERRHADPEPARIKDRAWYAKHRERLRAKRIKVKEQVQRLVKLHRPRNEAVRIFAKELHKNKPKLSLPQLGVKMEKKFCRKFSKSLVAYYLNT